MSELEKIAKQMVAKGKGILAADESTGTMTKRLSGVNVESTSENRLKFRETLFSAEGMKNHISGVILYDETIKQKTSSGKSIPDLIKSFGTIPGIKVDTGAKKLAGSPEEKITEGLDGLRERLTEYYKLGARFTKWRAVYNISDKFPSELAVKSNAHALARYAALVQEAKMVPIVEPEVLMDGNNSDVVELGTGQAVVLRIQEFNEAAVPTLEEVQPEIAVIIRTEMERAEVQKVGENLLDATERGEGLDELLTANELESIVEEGIERNSFTVNREIVTTAFGMPRPTALPELTTITLDNGTFVLLELNQVNSGVVDSLEQDELDALTETLSSGLGNSDFEAFLNNLRDNADIQRREVREEF